MMELRAIRKTECAVMGVLGACKLYAAEHGFEYSKDRFMVLDAEGKAHVRFQDQGKGFFTVQCDAEFEAPGLMKPTGYMDVVLLSMEKAENILRQRSGVQICAWDNHQYFLHDGAIIVNVSDGRISMMWFGGWEVTKHVASLLGILKEQTGWSENG